MEMPSFTTIERWIDAIANWLNELKDIFAAITADMPVEKFAGYDRQIKD